jgi:phage head maturation protease
MLVVNQLGLLQLSAEHDQRLVLVSTSGNSVAQSSEHSGMEVEGDPNPGQRDVVRPVDRGRVQAYSECDLDHSPDSREGGRW